MSQPINIEPKIRRLSAEKLITALASADLRGLPKHLQLSTAIVDLVRSGALEAGDQIPPEQQLAH
jgi:GntR family transcriptional regulator